MARGDPEPGCRLRKGACDSPNCNYYGLDYYVFLIAGCVNWNLVCEIILVSAPITWQVLTTTCSKRAGTLSRKVTVAKRIGTLLEIRVDDVTLYLFWVSVYTSVKFVLWVFCSIGKRRSSRKRKSGLEKIVESLLSYGVCHAIYF